MQKPYLRSHNIVYILVLLFLSSFFTMSFVDPVLSQDMESINGDHFVVHYTKDEQFASDVLRKAEDYYKEIARELGYGRHSDFWTWEKRVKIFIFPDRQSFIEATGEKNWSKGMANYTEKKILSYVWSKGFLDELLPHEIAHLIFRDFVGFKGEVPLWLDEGVAQWMEPKKKSEVMWVMAQIIEDDKAIPLKKLMEMDIRKEEDNEVVYIFYVEAASLVGFLIREYGSKQFAEFCRQLRDGKRLKTALTFAYPTKIRSLVQLEEKWLGCINKEGG